jgi:hypothetical protein
MKMTKREREEKSSPTNQAKDAKPAVPVRSPTERSNAHQCSDGRLLQHFRLGKGMKLYVARVRLRLKDFDITDLEKSQANQTMANILTGNGIPQHKAELAVAQTVDFAADHQLQPLRRDRYLKGSALAKKNLDRLIELFDQLVQVLSKFPPVSRGKLNKIVVGQDWRHFDTEAFDYLIHAMRDALPKLSPACVAQEALSIINEATLRVSEDLAVTQTIRTGPPAILDLWQIIPAATRTQVEEGIRRWPSCRSATAFFRDLATVLANSQQKTGRGPAVEGLFATRAAAIWRGLDLHVGRAYFGGDRSAPAGHYASNFQSFCKEAFAVFGEGSSVSERQVDRLKRELQRKNHRLSKTLK